MLTTLYKPINHLLNMPPYISTNKLTYALGMWLPKYIALDRFLRVAATVEGTHKGDKFNKIKQAIESQDIRTQFLY